MNKSRFLRDKTIYYNTENNDLSNLYHGGGKFSGLGGAATSLANRSEIVAQKISKLYCRAIREFYSL